MLLHEYFASYPEQKGALSPDQENPRTSSRLFLYRTNRLFRHRMKTLRSRKPTKKITHIEKAWRSIVWGHQTRNMMNIDEHTTMGLGVLLGCLYGFLAQLRNSNKFSSFLHLHRRICISLGKRPSQKGLWGQVQWASKWPFCHRKQAML